jgi:hypothetical protein
MNGIVVLHHLIFLLISITLTVWVGRTLSRNGRVFLLDSFGRNEAVANSINHLLVLGFYLINFGLVSLFLRFGDKPGNLVEFVELMSIKVGLVFLLLGLMHFSNMLIFTVFKRATNMNRESGYRQDQAPSTSDSRSRFFDRSVTIT